MHENSFIVLRLGSAEKPSKMKTYNNANNIIYQEKTVVALLGPYLHVYLHLLKLLNIFCLKKDFGLWLSLIV